MSFACATSVADDCNFKLKTVHILNQKHCKYWNKKLTKAAVFKGKKVLCTLRSNKLRSCKDSWNDKTCAEQE